jgi:hypothetical protein
MVLGDAAQGGKFTEAGIGEHNIHEDAGGVEDFWLIRSPSSFRRARNSTLLNASKLSHGS